MRNLKRVLSLALALVMVLGMMVITTSAATFTDAEEITYTEAVDVVSALGVINGYPAADGTYYFDADGTLTREQGAALICYLLMGKDKADKLSGSGNFTDVPADHWSAGEIDYCVNLGFIAGMGDGTFAPEAPLTALAYGKLLLCALGYDAAVEGYTGENWASAIASDMIEVGLDVKGVALDQTLTREAAAQMTFQALTKTLVKYESKGTSITINGAVISSGASTAEPQTYAENGGYDYTTGQDNAVAGDSVQFCEKYFDNLVKETGAGYNADIYGRPGYTWRVSNDWRDDIFVCDKATLTYNTAVTGGKLYSDLGKKTPTSLNIYRNGVQAGNTAANLATIVSGGRSVVDSDMGNGVLTEVYYNARTGAATIVEIWTKDSTIATFEPATKNADGQIVEHAYVTLADTGALKFYTYDFSDADEPVGNKPGTKVIYNWAGTSSAVTPVYLTNVVAAESAVITVSAVAQDKSCVADGVTYNFSKFNGTTPTFSAAPNATNEYTVWFDAYNNIIDAQAVSDEAATGYALVLAASTTGAGWTDGSASYQAKLLMPDGTTQTVDTDAASYNYIYNGGSAINALVKYEINNKGEYVFQGQGTSSATVADADNAFAMTKGVSKVTIDSSTDKYASAKTVFYVGTTNPNTQKVTWKVVTGIANMKTVEDKNATAIATLDTNGVLNAMVVLDAQDASGDSDVKDVAYIQYNAGADRISDATGNYKVYNAVIGGEITTVKVSTGDVAIVADTLASVLTYNDKGLVVAVNTTFNAPAASINAEQITVAVKDGIVTTSNDTYSVADDVVVYVDGNAGITAGSVADLKVGATMSAVLVNGIITTVFVTPAV